eukprot:762691-Hanusia_phi.AAC.5
MEEEQDKQDQEEERRWRENAVERWERRVGHAAALATAMANPGEKESTMRLRSVSEGGTNCVGWGSRQGFSEVGVSRF